MNVEVRRFGESRPTIVMIDGEPYPVREAAAKLGLPATTLQKRIERGASLVREYQRHYPGRW